MQIKPPEPGDLSAGEPRAEGESLHVRTHYECGKRVKDHTIKIRSPEERSEVADMRALVATQLGCRNIPPSWNPYILDGWNFCRLQMRQLADRVGGGDVGPGPGALIQSAALQLVMSRYIAADGMAENDIVKLKLASQLANDSRSNVLAAHELCVRESANRKKTWAPLSDDQLGAPAIAEKPRKGRPVGYDAQQRSKRAREERERAAAEQRRRDGEPISGDDPDAIVPRDDGV